MFLVTRGDDVIVDGGFIHFNKKERIQDQVSCSHTRVCIDINLPQHLFLT